VSITRLKMIKTDRLRKRLTGLIAAGFTPMKPGGQLNLKQIPLIVDHLISNGIRGLYLCGSTGEGSSLTIAERKAVVEGYLKAVRRRLPVIVAVGHESLAEAKMLAAHAQSAGADAISAAPPMYWKLNTVAALVDSMRQIAGGAPRLPFFYYHMPSLTGVNVDMVELLRLGSERIPTLAGLKYSAVTVPEFQSCLEFQNRRFIVLWGVDEMLLSALAVGAPGAVGSTYNIAAPLYHRVLRGFKNGNISDAAQAQALSVKMVRMFGKYRWQPGFKATMKILGVDCGPNRLPQVTLTKAEYRILPKDLKEIGFFEWGCRSNRRF